MRVSSKASDEAMKRLIELTNPKCRVCKKRKDEHIVGASGKIYCPKYRLGESQFVKEDLGGKR